MISTLSKKFKEQLQQEDVLKNQFKEIKCEHRKNSVSDLILNPSPMPVTTPPAEEFTPFFNFLSANKSVNSDILEFKRGAYYIDNRMDLCKQVVGDQHISKLMNSLKDNEHIEHFLLGNNVIGSVGGRSIAEFLNSPHKSQIKTWYLAGNELTSDSIRLISNALKNDNCCEALWLKRNPVKSEGAFHLGEMLKENKKIKILDLHNCGILDEGVKYVVKALKKNNTVRHIYLDANGITYAGVNYICAYFQFLINEKKKGVTSIWLDVNRLDDNSCILLASTAKNYKHLKRLYLGSNRITHKGAQELCQSFIDHPKLTVFDLGFYKSTADLQELPNSIGSEGVSSIVEFILKNKTVKILSILHNSISVEGLEKIGAALQQNDNIVYLYYKQYGVKIPQKLNKSIKQKLSANIKRQYNMTYHDFCKYKLRYIKGSDKLKNIDSIYRNKM
jgi:Ran GTPase-activating protein (RanGAP) involved in mRNA processing and transport